MNDRDQTIATIKAALKRRSGKVWSVTGGRGTAWGWITIDAPPARRTWDHRLKADASPAEMPEDYEEFDTGKPGGHMAPGDRKELGELLGLDGSAHFQGQSIPPDQYRKFIALAEGRQCNQAKPEPPKPAAEAAPLPDLVVTKAKTHYAIMVSVEHHGPEGPRQVVAPDIMTDFETLSEAIDELAHMGMIQTFTKHMELKAIEQAEKTRKP